MAICWYVYNGTGDVNSPSSYTLSSCTFRPTCCAGDRVCAIAAPNGGATPSVISANIQRYIANGLARQICQPDSPVGAVIWVRMKPTPFSREDDLPPSEVQAS